MSYHDLPEDILGLIAQHGCATRLQAAARSYLVRCRFVRLWDGRDFVDETDLTDYLAGRLL